MEFENFHGEMDFRQRKLTKGSLTCTRKAMSTTKLVMYPTTMPMIPLATIEEPMFTSNCKGIKALDQCMM